MSARKVARESLEDAFSAPSGPGRRGAGLARMLPPSRAPRPFVPTNPSDSEAPTTVRPVATETQTPASMATVRPDPENTATPSSTAPNAEERTALTQPVDGALPTEASPSVTPAAESVAASHVHGVAPAVRDPAIDVDTDDLDAVDIDAVENMPIYIDSATLTALKAEKGRIGGTYADVAEVALDEHIDDVGAILRQGMANSPQAGAFSSLPKRRKSPQIRGGIQVQLRFTKAQRDWLDEKVAEFSAPSRSVVVAVALQIHLGTRPQ